MTTTPIQNLIDALGLDELAPEEQEAMILEVHELVFRGALARTIELMDDATRADFDALLEKDPSEEEVDAFLKARVPGSETAVAEAVQEIADDILSLS